MLQDMVYLTDCQFIFYHALGMVRYINHLLKSDASLDRGRQNNPLVAWRVRLMEAL